MPDEQPNIEARSAASATRQVPSPAGGRSRSHTTATVGALLLAAGLGVVGLGATGRSSQARPAAALSGDELTDTVAIYGVEYFYALGGSPQIYVDTFTHQRTQTTRNTLLVTAGPVRPEGILSINGRVLLAGHELPAAGHYVTIPVELTGEDTLAFEITSGPDSSHYTVMIHRLPDATYNLAGPQVVNGKPSPDTVSTTFQIDTLGFPPFQVHMENAWASGSPPVDSVKLWLNGHAVPNALSSHTAAVYVDIQPQVGGNTLKALAFGPTTSMLMLWVTATDSTPPLLAIGGPPEDSVVSISYAKVRGDVQDQSLVRVVIDDSIVVHNATSFDPTVPLAVEGRNYIDVVAVDAGGNVSDTTISVIWDGTRPVLSWSTPASGTLTRESEIQVSGSVTDLTVTSVEVNGVSLTVEGWTGYTGDPNTMTFSGLAPLTVEGTNYLTVVATDAGGKTQSGTRAVTRDSQGPALTVTSPADSSTGDVDTIVVTGTVSDLTAVNLMIGVQQATIETDGSFATPVPLTEGENSIVLTATDEATNQTVVTLTVFNGEVTQELPPDPAEVAPPLDRTVATSMFDATSFLYAGPDSIQREMVPGTIVSERAAVVRGRVLNRDGLPLPAVRVSVHAQPEYGWTLSRADGGYDLAINGGGAVTLDFERDGWLSAQRTSQVPWEEYVVLDDLALVDLDSAATAVALTTSTDLQVVRGTLVTDEDGSRRATIMIPAGATADLLLPDGTRESITSATVRATEYTVGDAGMAAMPAMLPATSAYTYAVELSLDEAIAQDASVEFSEPVSFYIENFLNLPIGMPVPAGWYDRSAASWVPGDNALVIEVVGMTADSLAEVDLDGDGVGESGPELLAVGIDDDERRTLAATYAIGMSLWRASMDHFTSWDLNLASDGGSSAGGGNEAGSNGSNPPPCQTAQSGSLILCESQTLIETLDVPGTPFDLVYSSGRVAGRRDAYGVPISINGDSVPEGSIETIVQVRVAGVQLIRRYPADSTVVDTLWWDGLDAYGRRVQGGARANVRVVHTEPGRYLWPTADSSFGGYGGEPVRDPVTNELIATRMHVDRVDDEYSVVLGRLDASGMFDLGGWGLSVRHAYDPISGVLYKGDGTARQADAAVDVVRRVAGRGVCNTSNNWRQELAWNIGELCGFGEVEVSPDGWIYFVINGALGRVREGENFDLILDAGIFDFDLGPDGDIYMSMAGRNQVWRLGRSGQVDTIAGTGVAGYSGDGGPAAAAQLSSPRAISVAPDGSIYVVTDDHRMRRIAPGGLITTVAGTGTAGSSSSTVPALGAAINVGHIATGADGSVYLSEPDARRVRRIRRDGMIEPVLGNGSYCYSPWICGEGGPGIEAAVSRPSWIDVGPDGGLYVADHASGAPSGGGARMLKLTADDRVIRIAGGNGYNSAGLGDNGPATAAKLHIDGISVAPDGGVYFLSRQVIRAVMPATPRGFTGEIQVASEGGREVYVFSRQGWHLRTVDSRTGVALFSFSGTSQSLIVTDRNGLVTSLGNPIGGTSSGGSGGGGEGGESWQDRRYVVITGPYGHETRLKVADFATPDVLGPLKDPWLTEFVAPDSSITMLEYDTLGLGLLTRLERPGQRVHRYGYDQIGRLVSDEDPEGGVRYLTRSDSVDTYEIAFETPEGRRTRYGVDAPADLDTEQYTLDPAGLSSSTTHGRNGTQTSLRPDGTTVYMRQGADPRFGMLAPRPDTIRVTTPGGLDALITTSESVTLADAADPLSLTSQTRSVTVNGRTFGSAYDGATRTETISTPEGRTSEIVYDSLGLVVRTEAPGLLPVENTYDADGRLVSSVQGDRTWQYDYDAEGRLTQITDPAGRSSFYSYDAADRLIEQILPDSTEIAFRYDSAGNLVGLTPPGRPEHTFTYDLRGLATQYLPPTVGVPEPTGYTYDADQALTQLVRADSSIVTLDYDSAGRPSALMLPGYGSIGFGYDPATGTLVSLSAQDASVVFAYDGSLPRSVTWSGAVSGSVAVRYDNDLRVVEQTVNGTDTVAFGYDSDGLLTQAGALTLERDSATGFLEATQVGQVRTEWQYNAFGEPIGRVATFAADTLEAVTFARDSLGRIGTITEKADGVTTVWGYGYDLVGRLTTVTRDGAAHQSFEYDANGNRTLYVGPEGAIPGAYDDQDRLLGYGDQTFGYTANGELEWKAESGDTTRYAYDAAGNLRRVELPNDTMIDYLIDGQNRRIGVLVNGVFERGWLYQDQLNPIAEVDSAGVITTRFVYGDLDNLPAYAIRGDTVFRFLGDHLGSLRRVVNAQTGEVVHQVEYDAWGNALADSSSEWQTFGYAGGLYDTTTRLLRFGARDYSPGVGRWLAVDPLLFAGSVSNPHLYVENSPIEENDPSGECPWCVGALVGGVVGGAFDLGLQLIQNGGDLSCVDWGSVGKGALAGAAISALAPTGLLLGRGGARASQFGYGRTSGLLNRGATRFGWSGPKNGRDVLSVRIGRSHHDIRGSGLRAGANPLRDGAASGAIGGGVNRVANDPAGGDCGCE